MQTARCTYHLGRKVGTQCVLAIFMHVVVLAICVELRRGIAQILSF